MEPDISETKWITVGVLVAGLLNIGPHMDIQIFYPENLVSVLPFLTRNQKLLKLLNQQISNPVLLKSW